MTDYTTTTETVRERFADGFGFNYTEALGYFDRWLEEHDRQVYEEAKHDLMMEAYYERHGR